ncbi:hypothetical protein [Arthrobacter oryzae]|uniref:Uncharacterized protein n=1 Tax=Arthrobacter oryzae TaxID=409290 RepID=A0A3N0BRD0_9MICC|nr:hypothetical protein [Arthrobacter oryzae]RNL51583.1 hypothetical protein D7003_15760 [Arthrobacter oryzae]
MSATPLEAGGLTALKTERAARKAAEREVAKLRDQLATVKDAPKLWDRVKAAEDRAELWELRCKDVGRTVRHFKAEYQKYRDLHEQATISNNIYAD